MSARRSYVCVECGFALFDGADCPTHPDGNRWQYDQPLRIALDYVRRGLPPGAQWDDDYWPGTTAIHIALARSVIERWETERTIEEVEQEVRLFLKPGNPLYDKLRGREPL